jgi:hypothetical protein
MNDVTCSRLTLLVKLLDIIHPMACTINILCQSKVMTVGDACTRNVLLP